MSRYRDEIEFNPRRLAQVEERLHLIHSLQRKYGDTIPDVLAYGERAAAELETITHAGERIEELEADEALLLGQIGRLGATASAARRAAGERMARAIEAELADLQMARARFGVADRLDGRSAGRGRGCRRHGQAGRRASAGAMPSTPTGWTAVAFLVSANPGEPLRPLAKVASGGETSRLMLALKTVLGRADETPTLIFDEIDQGIGGRVGATVGRKLWGLTRDQGAGVRSQMPDVNGQTANSKSANRQISESANQRIGESANQQISESANQRISNTQYVIRNTPDDTQSLSHQVLCITHLPQLAAYGDVAFPRHEAGRGRADDHPGGRA